jgi:hypothetical protein
MRNSNQYLSTIPRKFVLVAVVMQVSDYIQQHYKYLHFNVNLVKYIVSRDREIIQASRN